MRTLSTIILIAIIATLTACGDAADPTTPNCDDAPDYGECIGSDAYLDERVDLDIEGDERNFTQQEPGPSETESCDAEQPPHFCEAPDRGCTWITHYEDNGKPYLACDCAFEIEQHHIEHYCEGDTQ